MFRHANTFANHPFHKTWSELKEKISKIDNKKITDSNTLIEFTRINKCINYIDSYLKIIDPDFCTDENINSLEDIDKYMTDISSYISEYNESNNRDHIIEMNNQIDNILQILSNFHTTLPKVSKRGISEMLKQYGDTIDESLSQINLPAVRQVSNQIQLFKQRLFDGEDENESIESQIEDLFEYFINKKDELRNFYDQTLNPECEDTTAKSIESHQELLETYKKDATNNMTELTNKIEEFNKTYVSIFGEKDSETGRRSGGLKEEFENRKKESDEFQESQKKAYSTLFEKIKSLLPDATSAGLASAYNDERKKFKTPLSRWNGVFIGSLLCMFLLTYCIWSNCFNWFTPPATEGIVGNLNGWLYRLSFYLPFIWLALYASRRRSELQRLDQEYAHKEALAKSYSSYKYQIDKLGLDKGDDALPKKLLKVAVKSTSRNPSETLGKHSSNTPIEETLKTILNIINKPKEGNTKILK